MHDPFFIDRLEELFDFEICLDKQQPDGTNYGTRHLVEQLVGDGIL